MACTFFDVESRSSLKRLLGIGLASVALLCSNVHADEVVYEDGSTNEWRVIDNDPAGATVSIVTDAALSSDVIEFAGAGRSNAYQLGGTAASNGGWNDTTRDQLSLKFRTSETYTIYVAVRTQGGFRYLLYEPRDENRGRIGSSYIFTGIGTATVSDSWVTLERDLAADLEAGEPGNVLLSVQGLVVRGDFRLDDVALATADTGGTNAAPVAEAGANQAIDLGATVTLDASGSTDDSAVTGWEWRDDQNAVIGTTETVAWTPTTAGALTVTLTVTDGDGATDSDTVLVTVTDQGTANTAPVADAGANQAIDLGQSVTLDASGSTDDGTVTGWEWRDDQNAVIGTTESVVWTPTAAGALTATLTVTDNDGATDSDTVVVTVTVTDPGGTSGSTVVYEDGSTNEWTVIDNDPAGATASIVTDAALSSDVIEFAGSGRSNAYQLGGTSATNGGWNDTTRDQLSFRIRASETYTIYVAVRTQGGFRYLLYEPRDEDRGLIGSSYIFSGVGTSTVSDSWVTIQRDLSADLEAGEPGNVLLSVQGLVVRGDFRIDDVTLSSGGGSTGGGNSAPVADAGADQAIDLGATVTLDASGSTDSDGTVSGWEWRDDQNALIGTTETVAWTPPAAGALTVTLTVTDDDGATDLDTVLVTVTDPGTANTAPIADAGANQAIDLGQSVTLDASGSTDSDGTISGWEWRDDQNAVIGTTETVVWTPTAAGALTATLTVTDDDGATDSDTVVVTVTDPVGTSGSTVVYEDGSTNEWTVIDNDPAGATSSIVTDADLSSDVIELAGAGRSNSYRLGGTRASNGGWDDITRDQLSLKMRTSEAYTLYVAVQTQGGFRYLIYEPRDDDRGLIGSSYIYNGVGTATVSGSWITIQRDLAADLQAGEPGNVLLSVQGLVVRGNIRIDDVALSGGTGGGTNAAPVAEAGANQAIDLGATVTLDASGSTDDSAVTGWEWRDDQNAVIGTTETVAWTPTTAGALTVTLTVTDGDGATDSDTVLVTVTDQGTANTAPVADAGANQAIDLGQSVTLDASGSTDDGTVTGWEWRDDQNAVIGTTESVVWTPTAAGALTATLTVTDNDGATDSDTVVVTVTVTDPGGTSGSTVVYEDGSTNEWTVIDNDPAGATASIVTDAALSSDVIEFAGSGRSNAYQLGGTSATNGGWNDTTRDQLSFRIRASETYTIYVAVRTQGGFRYLLYEPRDEDRGLIGSSYIFSGVGTSTLSDNWVTIQRDLSADLEAGEPGNVLLSVQGLVVRGDFRIDDVSLSGGSGGGTNAAPVADAGADQAIDLGATVTLDASGSTDDGTVTGWEWRDDQNAVIGTTESVVWTPTAAGALTVTLTVTDNEGATDSDTVLVTVTDPGLPACSGTAPCFVEEAVLTATDADVGDEFGLVVGLDAARAVVGAYRDDEAGSNAGAAYIIERTGGGAWGVPTKLLPSDGAANDGFGFAVDVDGDRAIVGSFRHELTSSTSGAGAAYIYERQANGDWLEAALLIPTELVASDQFGISVAINGDRALVGAAASGSTASPGAAYLFERQGGTWMQTDRLVPSDGTAGAQFGNAVDLQGLRAVVGARAAVGGSTDDVANAGAVYIYELGTSGTAVSEAKIGATGAQSADHFGKALSLDGNRVLVGAYGDRGDGSTANAGAAYLYELTGGTWVDIQKLEPTPAVTNDRFARTLSLAGNRALIGAYLNDTDGANTGTAFIYEPDANGDWSETQQLLPSNGDPGDFFGVHVALGADYALIGALKEDGPGNATTSSGAVYSFSPSN